MANEAQRDLLQESKLAENSSAQKDDQWITQAASDCWQSCKNGEQQSGFNLATANPDWLEQRAQQRKDELAVQYGLDPKTASMDAIIQARAAQGTQQNEGRVERLRVDEAIKYGLDPAKADWTKINIARVDARKKELGMEK